MAQTTRRRPSGSGPAGLLRGLQLIVTILLLMLSFWPARGQEAPGPGAPAAAANPLAGRHEKAAIFYLHGQVDDMMLSSIHRRVDLARKAGCSLIIYDIDTYGGSTLSGLEISRYTKTLEIPVVAYVNKRAYSSGVMVALACRQVVMAPESSIGDCETIAVDEGGHPHGLNGDLRAKFNSPVLEQLDDSAQRNGFNRMLAHAMVVRELEVYHLRNANTGEDRYVAGIEEKDKLIKETIRTPDGKEITPWRFVETIDGPNQLLTINPDKAVAMGLARGVAPNQPTVNSEQELLALYDVGPDPLRLDFHWTEQLTMFLSQWWVRGLLFVVMLILGYIEISHPGISVAGIGALVCLGLIVGAPYLTGMAQVWEIVLIAIGVVLVAIDLFVTPGFGLLAVPGFIIMAVGLVATFIPPSVPGGNGFPQGAQWYLGLQRGLMVVVFGSAISLVTFFLLARYLYLTPGFHRLRLAPTGVTPPSEPLHDASDLPTNDAVFVGALGQVAADLHPAGKVRFDQHLMDVVSEGQFIPAGTPVVVIEIQGNRVVVKPQAPRTPGGGTAPGSAAPIAGNPPSGPESPPAGGAA